MSDAAYQHTGKPDVVVNAALLWKSWSLKNKKRETRDLPKKFGEECDSLLENINTVMTDLYKYIAGRTHGN